MAVVNRDIRTESTDSATATERLQLDVLAVGAHPDDIEIACGGTLAKLAAAGLSRGHRRSDRRRADARLAGPEVRLAEARRAAEVLGVVRRMTLDLPNRRLFDTFEARVALAKEFRRYRPRLVIGLGGKTPTASPDHYQASLIIEAAVFYAKLTKWDEHFDGLPPYRRCRAGWSASWRSTRLAPADRGAMVVDIGDTLEKKLAAIACYASQFPPAKADFLDRLPGVRHATGHGGRFRGRRSAWPVRPPGAPAT